MISKQEILDRAQEWQLRAGVVEKDYVIGWLLWGISNFEPFKDSWIFKGGTCLKKCFIETYRFSEDLDFTVLPGGPIAASQVSQLIPDLLGRIAAASGINFSISPPKFKDRPKPGNTEGRLYYQGPLLAPTPASIKLDLSTDELVVQPSVLRPVAHPYSDAAPDLISTRTRCYGLEEVFAEKIRALGQRNRPRDLYDVINLYRRRDLRLAPGLIHTVLGKKCAAKGIPVPTYAGLVDSPLTAELHSEWEHMLAHQLPALPPIQGFLDELDIVFKWLAGELSPVELPPVPSGNEQIDHEWAPPPTVWQWGYGIPLESVRFAGANRLCVDLTYNGTVRRIEPYSFRRTRAGEILLYAVKHVTAQIRSYRVDRIQALQVSTEPFTPKFQVEFSEAAGHVERPGLQNLTIPTRARGPRAPRPRRPRRSRR